MVLKGAENYKLLGFEKSKRKNAMYNAILMHEETGRKRRIPFGDKRYQNYRDITGKNLYPHLIHNDKKRRENYRKRHQKTARNLFSSSFFSYNYLW